MIFDASKTGKWELVLIYDKDRNMVGPAEFTVKEDNSIPMTNLEEIDGKG
jgi:hypothetical protein